MFPFIQLLYVIKGRKNTRDENFQGLPLGGSERRRMEEKIIRRRLQEVHIL